MIRITADTLEDAYKKASDELGLSIVDLELEILQAPSSGFLGLFKKQAIITATPKSGKSAKNHFEHDEINTDDDMIVKEIKDGIKELMKNSCFDIELKEISIDCDDMVHIKLDGADAALLIGKEGYRYKALSYMLHNWIKIKYDKNISLEIGEFLKNQATMIDEYLSIIYERVDDLGYAKTKPLDGILVKIALDKLRERYPDKYVAIRTQKDGRKRVIINEYKGERR